MTITAAAEAAAMMTMTATRYDSANIAERIE